MPDCSLRDARICACVANVSICCVRVLQAAFLHVSGKIHVGHVWIYQLWNAIRPPYDAGWHSKPLGAAFSIARRFAWLSSRKLVACFITSVNNLLTSYYSLAKT